MDPTKRFVEEIEILEMEVLPQNILGKRYGGIGQFEDGDEYSIFTDIAELDEGEEYVVLGGFEESPMTGEPVAEISKIVARNPSSQND